MPRGRGRGIIAGPFQLGPHIHNVHEGDGLAPALPPAPPGPGPLDTEVGTVLTTLGFPEAIITQFVNEGISLLSHFLMLQKEVVDHIFARLDFLQIAYTAIQFSMIKSLHHFIRRMNQLNMPVTPTNITIITLINEVQYIEETKAASLTQHKSRVAPPEKFKDHSKWREFEDVFINYLYSLKGARNVPLYYVIRPDLTPADADHNDQVYTTPLFGDLFKLDNAEVFTLLERSMIAGPGETYVKEFSKKRNGRAAFYHLKNTFDGATVIATKASNAWKTLQTTKYSGKRPNFDFQAYRSVMDEAFRDLKESGSSISDVDKIHFLLFGMEGEELRQIKNGVVNGPLTKENYLEAVLYILRCIANDSIIDKKQKLVNPTISALSTRSYDKQEWNALSLDDKEKIPNLRQQERSQSKNGRNNNRSGRGHGRVGSGHSRRIIGNGGGHFGGGRAISNSGRYFGRGQSLLIDGSARSERGGRGILKRSVSFAQFSSGQEDTGYLDNDYEDLDYHDTSDATEGLEPKEVGSGSCKIARIAPIQVFRNVFSVVANEEICVRAEL